MISSPTVALPATTILWVALGGAIGSALRFAVSDIMRRLPALASLPWATLFVNVTGSFVIGWYLRSVVSADASPQLRAFIAIGICGGYTTFSTFALENAQLLENGLIARAAVYAIASVTLSIGATFLGYAVAR
ncbi:MAG TPA: fluoride efflux transporter CrcB [Gemmatimonadaceae bacterium]|nr:fluoride efflux transporter CrcB [Gemmatimonadaceae bacterium]